MARSWLVGLVVAAAFVVGCGGGDLAAKIPGTWKMQIDSSGMAEKDKAMVEMAKSFLSSMSITLKEDKTAELTAMGQSEKGKWSLEGDKITITAEKGDPMVGVVSSDGNTITPDKSSFGGQDMKGAKITLVKEAKK